MAAPYWTNRLCTAADVESVLDLVRAVQGEGHAATDRAYWQWRYLNETEFRADILMAEYEGRPIGIQPMAVFEYQWNSDRVRGAMYTGVLTHPDHRRRGIFRSLVASANEHAAQRGAQFSMTLPNEASFPDSTAPIAFEYICAWTFSVSSAQNVLLAAPFSSWSSATALNAGYISSTS